MEERRLGNTTVLFGAERGKYPDANSVLVRGPEESVLIDPALGIVARHDDGSLPNVDRVLLSHCHEDHLSGLFLYPDVPVGLHEGDRPGLESLDAMMEIYGLSEPHASRLRRAVTERFHFQPRPDAVAFDSGTEWSLGGNVVVRALHAPGHTRGHCAFLVEPDGVLFTGDVDLSGFGPYYGDAWSSLDDFERSLAGLAAVEARYYVTAHHRGLVEGSTAFREALERYTAVITKREDRLLDYLGEPHSLDELVDHRFVYRPQDPPTRTPLERRHVEQHIERLLRQGRIVLEQADRYVRSDG
jgi:glyoxylase-like metal-dependent hydrolase (beta-lactamase superfamily II)